MPTQAAGERSKSIDVSLVVIAYNERDRAPDAVRSILNQRTDAEFELIFVDDGSTDETAPVAAAAAAGDQRFRSISLSPNRGRGAARTAGIEAARGRAIGFVDADIVLPPDWLARCLEELPGNAAVGGVPVPDGDASVLAQVSGATPRIVGGGMAITGSNVLFDAEVLAKVGFDPRDRLGEDFKLAARLRRNGYRLRRVPGLVVAHADSKSYAQGLRWRFENGLDAATHPRELRIIRFADFVWAGWLGASLLGIAGAWIVSPLWVLLGPAAAAAAGVTHAVTRFQPKPLVPFALACLADVPLMAAYLLGRTVGLRRLILGRR